MAIVTADAVKTWLNVPASDGIDDVNLATAAAAADEAVRQFCEREFEATAIGSETARVFTPTHGAKVKVDDFYDTTNLVIKTDDNDDGTFETTWTSSDYELEPVNRVIAGITWPYQTIRAVESRLFPTNTSRSGVVQVTAAWGFAATVPDAVTNAALLQAARWFRRKDTPEGHAGGEFGVIRVSKIMDPDVEQMLMPYRRGEAFF